SRKPKCSAPAQMSASDGFETAISASVVNSSLRAARGHLRMLCVVVFVQVSDTVLAFSFFASTLSNDGKCSPDRVGRTARAGIRPGGTQDRASTAGGVPLHPG